MADAEPAAASKAEFLAGWMELDDAGFGVCYVTVFQPGKAADWETLVALSGTALKLRACEEATKAGFLDNLARAVANWEFRAGRPPIDVAEMIDRVCSYGLMQGMSDQQKGFLNPQIFEPLMRARDACAIVKREKPVETPLGTAFLVRPDLVLTAAHVVMATQGNGGAATWLDRLKDHLVFEFPARPNQPAENRVMVRPAAENALVASASHDRARAYNPAMGRFMQTDPIGTNGGMNIYAYVRNNPVNRIDPSGLEDICLTDPDNCPVVTGHRERSYDDWIWATGYSGFGPTVYFDGFGVGGPQDTSIICSNGRTTLAEHVDARTGHRSIQLGGNIDFEGSNSEENASIYVTFLQDYYVLGSERYTVSNTFERGPGGIVAHVVDSATYQGHGYTGGHDIYLPNTFGANVGHTTINRNTIGHEVGHNFGLIDRYHNGHADLGYEDSTMGDGYNGHLNDVTASELVSACEHPQVGG